MDYMVRMLINTLVVIIALLLAFLMSRRVRALQLQLIEYDAITSMPLTTGSATEMNAYGVEDTWIDDGRQIFSMVDLPNHVPYRAAGIYVVSNSMFDECDLGAFKIGQAGGIYRRNQLRADISDHLSQGWQKGKDFTLRVSASHPSVQLKNGEVTNVLVGQTNNDVLVEATFTDFMPSRKRHNFSAVLKDPKVAYHIKPGVEFYLDFVDDKHRVDVHSPATISDLKKSNKQHTAVKHAAKGGLYRRMFEHHNSVPMGYMVRGALVTGNVWDDDVDAEHPRAAEARIWALKAESMLQDMLFTKEKTLKEKLNVAHAKLFTALFFHYVSRYCQTHTKTLSQEQKEVVAAHLAQRFLLEYRLRHKQTDLLPVLPYQAHKRRPEFNKPLYLAVILKEQLQELGVHGYKITNGHDATLPLYKDGKVHQSKVLLVVDPSDWKAFHALQVFFDSKGEFQLNYNIEKYFDVPQAFGRLTWEKGRTGFINGQNWNALHNKLSPLLRNAINGDNNLSEKELHRLLHNETRVNDASFLSWGRLHDNEHFSQGLHFMSADRIHTPPIIRLLNISHGLLFPFTGSVSDDGEASDGIDLAPLHPTLFEGLRSEEFVFRLNIGQRTANESEWWVCKEETMKRIYEDMLMKLVNTRHMPSTSKVTRAYLDDGAFYGPNIHSHEALSKFINELYADAKHQTKEKQTWFHSVSMAYLLGFSKLVIQKVDGQADEEKENEFYHEKSKSTCRIIEVPVIRDDGSSRMADCNTSMNTSNGSSLARYYDGHEVVRINDEEYDGVVAQSYVDYMAMRKSSIVQDMGSELHIVKPVFPRLHTDKISGMIANRHINRHYQDREKYKCKTNELKKCALEDVIYNKYCAYQGIEENTNIVNEREGCSGTTPTERERVLKGIYDDEVASHIHPMCQPIAQWFDIDNDAKHQVHTSPGTDTAALDGNKSFSKTFEVMRLLMNSPGGNQFEWGSTQRYCPNPTNTEYEINKLFPLFNTSSNAHPAECMHKILVSMNQLDSSYSVTYDICCKAKKEYVDEANAEECKWLSELGIKMWEELSGGGGYDLYERYYQVDITTKCDGAMDKVQLPFVSEQSYNTPRTNNTPRQRPTPKNTIPKQRHTPAYSLHPTNENYIASAGDKWQYDDGGGQWLNVVASDAAPSTGMFRLYHRKDVHVEGVFVHVTHRWQKEGEHLVQQILNRRNTVTGKRRLKPSSE